MDTIVTAVPSVGSVSLEYLLARLELTPVFIVFDCYSVSSLIPQLGYPPHDFMYSQHYSWLYITEYTTLLTTKALLLIDLCVTSQIFLQNNKHLNTL